MRFWAQAHRITCDLGECVHDAHIWANKPTHNRHTTVKKILDGILSIQLGIGCFAGCPGPINAPTG
jgi:hypothetical protein